MSEMLIGGVIGLLLALVLVASVIHDSLPEIAYPLIGGGFTLAGEIVGGLWAARR